MSCTLSSYSGEGDVTGQKLAPSLPPMPALQQDIDFWGTCRGECRDVTAVGLGSVRRDVMLVLLGGSG